MLKCDLADSNYPSDEVCRKLQRLEAVAAYQAGYPPPLSHFSNSPVAAIRKGARSLVINGRRYLGIEKRQKLFEMESSAAQMEV